MAEFECITEKKLGLRCIGEVTCKNTIVPSSKLYNQHIFLVTKSENDIFEEVLRGELEFTSDSWPTFSESAKDFVRKMLIRNPKRRITAHGVLLDNNRYITFEELKAGLKRFGSNLKESEIYDLLQSVAENIVKKLELEQRVGGSHNTPPNIIVVFMSNNITD
ncbi:hypothetical protein LXL04_004544 [Taraxacum kok-saghyz]